MFDRAVLAGRIKRLKYQEHRPAVLGIEHVLKGAERLNAKLETFSGPWFIFRFETGSIAGVDVVQPEVFSFCHSIPRGERLCALDNLV
jgi:hypothetical protein